MCAQALDAKVEAHDVVDGRQARGADRVGVRAGGREEFGEEHGERPSGYVNGFHAGRA